MQHGDAVVLELRHVEAMEHRGLGVPAQNRSAMVRQRGWVGHEREPRRQRRQQPRHQRVDGFVTGDAPFGIVNDRVGRVERADRGQPLLRVAFVEDGLEVSLQQAAQLARTEPAGALTITAAPAIGTHLLGPALPRFHRRHPGVRVNLRMTDQLLDLVDEGIDVAIRVGHSANSELRSRRFGPHRVGCFASPAYLAKRGTPKTPDDLQHHDCVAVRFQSTGLVLRWPFQVGRRVVELEPKVWATVDSTEANAALLAGGGGISVLPMYVARAFVKRKELTPVLENYAVDRHAFTAIWPATRSANPNVKAFLTFLDDVFH
ncbi:MAG: LysR family transcriptional regulator [Archangium gephyra]|uniref:LysR family transcriptional regulator n=1 Tax=Archangium gephyra TaxID=48 RepID=A0A2W5TDL2_9BACT|nr:MAG: LysR family transcriptional regulator [Archangium gephyra]